MPDVKLEWFKIFWDGLIKDSRQSSWNCWNIRENICLAGYTRMKEGFPVWIIWSIRFRGRRQERNQPVKFRNCLDIFVKSFIPPCYAEIHFLMSLTIQVIPGLVHLTPQRNLWRQLRKTLCWKGGEIRLSRYHSRKWRTLWQFCKSRCLKKYQAM